MSRSHIAAIAAAVAVLAGGCGGSSAATSSTSGTQTPAQTSTASAPPGWTGMGAPLSSFQTAHPPDTSGCATGGCYGGGIPYTGQGQCCEFVDLSTTGPPDNRVDGYTEAFRVGTSVAAAKFEALALMPSDTTTTASFIHHDSSGHTCELWNIQSPTLGKWFSTKKVGDPQGVMGIDLNTINTQQVFSARNVTQAVIGIGAAGHTTDC
jgi:hypothetical protein